MRQYFMRLAILALPVFLWAQAVPLAALRDAGVREMLRRMEL
jgi:hypothetical protein